MAPLCQEVLRNFPIGFSSGSAFRSGGRRPELPKRSVFKRDQTFIPALRTEQGKIDQTRVRPHLRAGLTAALRAKQELRLALGIHSQHLLQYSYG